MFYRVLNTMRSILFGRALVESTELLWSAVEMFQ
jgi:hypothetical protein